MKFSTGYNNTYIYTHRPTTPLLLLLLHAETRSITWKTFPSTCCTSCPNRRDTTSLNWSSSSWSTAKSSSDLEKTFSALDAPSAKRSMRTCRTFYIRSFTTTRSYRQVEDLVLWWITTGIECFGRDLCNIEMFHDVYSPFMTIAKTYVQHFYYAALYRPHYESCSSARPFVCLSFYPARALNSEKQQNAKKQTKQQ